VWVAIDRLPSGRFRARLMIGGRRHTATWLTEADARGWEIETRAAVAKRRGAGSVTFAAYAERWFAGFIDDAPDRARFEATLKRRLVPVLGDWLLYEVLEADRNGLYRLLLETGGDEDEGDTWECLRLVLEDAVEDLRAGILDFRAPVGVSRSRR
jgi:hypothetical protein